MDVSSLDPGAMLAAWAAGIAVAATVVAWWAIVGRGFHLLGAATVAGIAAGSAALGGDLASWVAVGAAIVAGLVAPRRWPMVAFFGLAATALVVSASGDGLALGLAGAAAMGGTTSVMLLGHWYLVDPRLPRISLQRLTMGAGTGVVADAALTLGRSSGGTPLLVAVAVYGGTALLLTGVWFSLKEEGYQAVMAATCLSYLAVLTALGAVSIGRTLI